MNIKTLNFSATLILALVFSFFMPWWSIMVAAFIAGFLFSLKKAAVFFVPFLAILLLWMVYSLMISSGNDFTLAKKIAVLLPLGGNAYLLLLVTGIVGGVAAGIAGIFGKQCQVLLRK